MQRFLFLLSLLFPLSSLCFAAALLNWQDDSHDADGFRVYRRVNGDAETVLTEVAANVTQTIDNDIAPGQQVEYQVSTFNAFGESARSNIACANVVAGIPLTVTLPAPGATVSGAQSLIALPDLVGVQLLIDGVPYGPELTQAPYVAAWKTAQFANGTHVIAAIGRSSTGTTVPSPEVTVTVANALVASLVYRFDEGSGATAKDGSGNGRDGTITGATWTTAGKSRAALVFNGGTAKVTSLLTSTAASHTIMLWTYRTGQGGNGMGRIFDKRMTGTEVEVFYNANAEGTYRYIRGSGHWTIPQPSANAWHHVAVVFDAAAGKPTIYVDGVAAAITQQKAAASIVDNADPYVIGNRGAGDRGWAGMLNEFQVYDRALTQAEVQGRM